jgi:hypothetical protein
MKYCWAAAIFVAMDVFTACALFSFSCTHCAFRCHSSVHLLTKTGNIAALTDLEEMQPHFNRHLQIFYWLNYVIGDQESVYLQMFMNSCSTVTLTHLLVAYINFYIHYIYVTVQVCTYTARDVPLNYRTTVILSDCVYTTISVFRIWNTNYII